MEAHHEEPDLLERMRQGDQAALGALFSLHRARLRQLVDFRLDSRLRGRVDPSDVLQELFLDVTKRLAHFVDGPALPFYVWLRQIALQRLVEVHRHHLKAEKRSAQREQSLEPRGSATSVSMAVQIISRLASPSTLLVRSEMTQQLHQALQTMDATDREVLALRHFEELSNDEAAAVLGLSKSAASNRYVRALARLKKILVSIPGFFDQLSSGPHP